MKIVLGVILGGMLLLPVVSNAADAQPAADNKKPVNSWTCEDFLAVDESFQPTAVGFAEALNNKDKPEDAVLDVFDIFYQHDIYRKPGYNLSVEIDS